jgi:hypothetical protein
MHIQAPMQCAQETDTKTSFGIIVALLVLPTKARILCFRFIEEYIVA